MIGLRWLARALVPEKYRAALRLIPYLGNQVVCPCCGWHFRKFLPYGLVPRPNALCPRCGSKERHRAMLLYLKHKTNFFRDNLRVLHFAPEACLRHAFGTAPNLDYISADLVSPAAMVRMDITAIPCEADAFDVVICLHVLEHVLDDQKAMSELFRVLRQGGLAIIQSPVALRRDETFEDANITAPEDRERVFGHPDHVRIYGRDYKRRLEEAGFNVTVRDVVKELGDIAARRHAFAATDGDLYLCTKLNPVALLTSFASAAETSAR